MKEFVEKLIGRLEEEKNKAEERYHKYLDDDNYCNLPCVFTIADIVQDKVEVLTEVKEIVNQLEEEYKDKVIIDRQYCWQTCGANEHCKECNRLSNGSIDYYENYDCLAEEYNNEVCEWEWGIDYAQVQCRGDKILFGSRRLFTYCPYCGKKIKAVE